MNKHIQAKNLGIFTLLLIYSGVNCRQNYAFPSPEVAEISEVIGPRLTIEKNIDFSENLSFPATEGEILEKYKDALLVPGNNKSQANLILLKNSQDDFTLFTAGSDTTPTVYSIPCRISVGMATVGFSEEKTPCKDGVRIATYRNTQVKRPENNLEESFPALKRSLKAQNSVSLFQYCSIVSASGKGWGVSYSQSSSVNPCQSATEKCQQVDRESECYLASWGEWDINDRELLISSQCQGILPFTRQKNGQEIAEDFLDWMEERHRILSDIGCVFYVYQPEETIILPASEEATLVQVYDYGGGNLAIDALVGNVKMLSSKRPQGSTIVEGSGYRSGREPRERERRILLNCPVRFKSQSIQDFLQPSSWSKSNNFSRNRSIRRQLNNYRENFCQSAPPSLGTSDPISIPFLPWFPFPGRQPSENDQNQTPQYPRNENQTPQYPRNEGQQKSPPIR